MKAEKDYTEGGQKMSADSSPKISANHLSDNLLKDKIRRRAYELYLERRGTGGSELEDWLRAQAEVVWKLSH